MGRVKGVSEGGSGREDWGCTKRGGSDAVGSG